MKNPFSTLTDPIDPTITKALKDSVVLADVQKKLNDIRQQRVPHERKWYLNTAFFFGRQYVGWVTQGSAQKFIETTSKNRVRAVHNKCRPLIRTEVAKLLKNRPRGFVLPNTTDDVDRIASSGARKLYDAMYPASGIDVEGRMRDAVFHGSLFGNGFIKTYYDKNKKDFTGTLGSIVVETINPFSLFVPDLLATEIEQQPYIIQLSDKEVSEINSQFNVNVSPNSKPVESTGTNADSRYLTALGNTARSSTTKVTVAEAWIKPCTQYPKGAHVIFAEGKLLSFIDEYPYKHGQFPYTKINGILSGQFYNDSILSDVIPLQKQYNRSVSQLIEIRNAASKPTLVAQAGSIDPSKITNEPGQIIQYLPGTTPPHFETPPSQPNYVMDLLNIFQQDINDTSGQHEVTHGSTPAGVTAAAAIGYLQEEDNNKLATTTFSIEAAHAKVASQVLSLFAQYCTVERVVKIIGDNNDYEAQMFSASTLKGNTDYRVESGSGQPTSIAAKQAFLTDLHEKQVIDAKQLLSRLDMAEVSGLYEEVQRDTRQAEREIAQFADPKKNELLVTADYEDDVAHIVAHRNYAKTEQFDKLKPEQQQAILQHIKEHHYKLAGMYGRNDLLPMVLNDPSTGQPITDKNTGRPKLTPDNPQLLGFVNAIITHGPPPPAPPPTPPGMQAPAPQEAAKPPQQG